MDDDTDKTALNPTVVQLRPEQVAGEPRAYSITMVDTLNQRRYRTQECPHRGPYLVDRRLATVECQDCGALLNPMFCLEMLSAHEAYWNARQKDLAKHLEYLNEEIATRTRTRCAHCGNMTPIRIAKEVPRTWVPRPY